jgi:hypothetical protein
MKKLYLLILLTAVFSFGTYGQSRVYVSGGPEIIFSFADIDNNGIQGGNIIRFAPVINFSVMGNIDLGQYFGFFFGGSIRNVGFIYDYPDSISRFKYRSYNLGIPVGFKVGKMNKTLFYAGYEIEFPFAYKQKEFYDNTKKKFTEWFTPRLPSYYHSFMVGVQFPYGFSLKFKYYYSEFFNQDYVGAGGVQPYQGLEAHVFYFSLNFGLFRNSRAYYDEYKRRGKKEYY